MAHALKIEEQNLNYELNRKYTLVNWKQKEIDVNFLAMTGFFYTQISNTVKCFFCNLYISEWTSVHDITKKHISHSPSCPLLSNSPNANVPLNSFMLGKLIHDININCQLSVSKNYQRRRPRPTNLNLEQKNDQKFDTYEQRFYSFINWPENSKKQTVNAFAKYGFFYTGRNDIIECFSCKFKMGDWQENDNVQKLHQIYGSDCVFMNELNYDLNCTNKYNNNFQGNLQKEQKFSQKLENKLKHFDTNIKYCKICTVYESNTVFFPCGHVFACLKCAFLISNCPVCRCEIKFIKRIFYS